MHFETQEVPVLALVPVKAGKLGPKLRPHSEGPPCDAAAPAEGSSLKDVASKLKLSVKTVDAHRYNIMRKLDLHDRTQLIHFAIRNKLIGDYPVGMM